MLLQSDSGAGDPSAESQRSDGRQRHHCENVIVGVLVGAVAVALSAGARFIVHQTRRNATVALSI